MGELLRDAERVARSDAKVLITGESGTGKDVIARHVHYNSARRSREYVAVNCAGVAESLLESELFGHLKGSFTGAYRDQIGKLKLADGGTLFLDEVGEMSLKMQALLLRFLENGEIQPVGADLTTTNVDVRVITATNRNLSELVSSGQFREDLLYRLRVVHLHVPPLRDRAEDVRELADHFMRRLGREVELTDDAWKALQRYRWPGNVRELQNVVEQIVAMNEPGASVGLASLPLAVIAAASQPLLPVRERRRQVADELYESLVNGNYDYWEHIYPLFLNRDLTRHDMRELIRRGLSVTRGNYRGLLQLFKIPAGDYKRFMNVLTTHDCRADFREFRNPSAERSTSPRIVRAPLPTLPDKSDRKAQDDAEVAS
jgi:transcriptional regulator with PAS, ATPase and Fis domain